MFVHIYNKFNYVMYMAKLVDSGNFGMNLTKLNYYYYFFLLCLFNKINKNYFC